MVSWRNLVGSLGLASCVLAQQCMRKKLIIDSDFYSFIEDGNRLTTLPPSELHMPVMTWGETDILAISLSIRSQWAPPAVDGIDTYYQHPDIPIAIQKPLDNSTTDPTYPLPDYVVPLATQFPEDIMSGYNTSDPVPLLRTVLANSEDSSVTICAIGFFDNLYLLVNSPPDSISPLSGFDLVAKKVSELVIQGNPNGISFNLGYHNGTWAADVINRWPAALTFVPSAIGRNVRMGKRLTVQSDLKKEPVALAFNITVGYNKDDPAWDPTAVYYAVRGTSDGTYAFNETKGSFNVTTNGTVKYQSDIAPPSGKQQAYVKLLISNVTFANNLEDILLWKPGAPALDSSPCAGSGNNGTGAAPSGTATSLPLPTIVSAATRSMAGQEIRALVLLISLVAFGATLF